MMRLAVLTSLVVAVPASAATLDSQAKDAYRWRVILKTGKHPVLGPAFREQVGREVRAALQGSVGPVAAVDLVDLAREPVEGWEPLWKEFVERGWPALDPDPRAGRELTGVKTHFLTIDFRDGNFVLESRQQDGSTGLASPLVRRQSVRAADMVGRTAGLMLEPDFGPVATAEVEGGNNETCRILFRASAIVAPEKFVKAGDVFAVSLVREMPVKPGTDRSRPGAVKYVATPQDYTLLKVVEPPKEGAAKCQILTRFVYPFGRDRRTVGVRCLKLPTVESTVRLRLVGQDGAPHPRGSLVSVTATDSDYSAKASAQDGFEFRDGVYKSGRALSGVACVLVAVGQDRPQKFPLPVFSDDPITLKFAIKPEDEKRAVFVRTCSDLRNNVADAAMAQQALYKEMTRLIDTAQNTEALKRGEDGVKAADVAEKTLGEELKALREEPESQEATAKAILETCDDRLKLIASARNTLAQTIGKLKEAVAKHKDPIKVEKEFREKELELRIKELVTRGDIPEALEAYEQVIALRPQDQAVKDQREKLQGEWAPKDEEHRQARGWMKGWIDARSQADFAEAVPLLKKAVEVMARKGDKLGLRKMLNIFETGYTTLKILVEAIDTRTEEGAATAKELEAIVNQARDAETEARETLKTLSAK
jgi:tetratricopeptide (TPR) repeat protein